MIIKGKLASSNDPSSNNGKIYSPESLCNMIKEFDEKKYFMVGELGGGDSSVVSLSSITHQMTSVYTKNAKMPRKKKKKLKKLGLYSDWVYKNNSLFGIARILNTPEGNMIKRNVNSGDMAFVPRGSGKLANGVVEDFELITFDIVPKNIKL